MPFSEKTTNATLSAYYFQAKLNIKSYGKYTPYTSQTILFSENPREAITISKHSQTYHDDVTKHIRRPRHKSQTKTPDFLITGWNRRAKWEIIDLELTQELSEIKKTKQDKTTPPKKSPLPTHANLVMLKYVGL